MKSVDNNNYYDDFMFLSLGFMQVITIYRYVRLYIELCNDVKEKYQNIAFMNAKIIAFGE